MLLLRRIKTKDCHEVSKTQRNTKKEFYSSLPFVSRRTGFDSEGKNRATARLRGYALKPRLALIRGSEGRKWEEGGFKPLIMIQSHFPVRLFYFSLAVLFF